ncbi:unnamed protein product [Phaedon cochleariae]|uniref:Mitochondrial carrier protein n=1 Tax=Phaedon cochleariae TaxID=80249 RepID=A0A9P0DU98_PHACE|nr:unnamed protein product [Phaedon cochleariae]
MVSNSYTRDFVCGLGSAVTTTAITFPINKLIYRQVLVGGNLGKAFNSIRQEGIVYLYRGGMPPLVQKATCLSTMFGVYNSVTMPLKKYHLNEYVEKVCGSCVSATVEAAFVPFERIQVLLVHSKYNDRFKNMVHTFREVHKHYGVREFYRGFTVVWIRNIASNCCFFITKGEIQKSKLMKNENYSSGLKNFVSGGVLGLMMSTFFYPCKVMKIVLHQNLGGRFLSLRETASIVYRRNGRGMRNFYTGVVTNGVRSLLSWGITNMTFEFLRHSM